MITIDIPIEIAGELRMWMRQSLELLNNGPKEAGFKNLEYEHVENICDLIEGQLEEFDIDINPEQENDSWLRQD